jgi:glycosyltransferase involved in cell wall biosynthesis
MWPSWCDTLQYPSGQLLAEGGQRLAGRYKSGTTEEPLISFITVVKNNARQLPRALKSVQRQTYQPVEHIVLDGASTDGTLDVLQQYEKFLAYYASEPDNGIYHAMNKAIPLARGSIICLLNSDDWLVPEAAAIAAAYLAGGSCALLASTAIADSRVWIPTPVNPGTYFRCMDVCHNGIYATRKAYECSGPYDESYKITADFKWVMTCFDNSVKFIYTDKETIHFSAGGLSRNLKLNALDTIRVIKDRFPFLEERDIHSLYYYFYRYIGVFAPSLDFNDPEDTQFLIRLLEAHSDKRDFITALAWALWEKTQQQLQAHDPSFLPDGLREGVKIMLRGTPWFGPCRQIYHVLRRITNRL